VSLVALERQHIVRAMLVQLPGDAFLGKRPAIPPLRSTA
jgi:hypothetical protein